MILSVGRSRSVNEGGKVASRGHQGGPGSIAGVLFAGLVAVGAAADRFVGQHHAVAFASFCGESQDSIAVVC